MPDSSAIGVLDQALALAPNARIKRELSALKENLPPASDPALEFLRIQAIRSDLSEGSNHVLDQAGVPFVSERDAGKLCAHAIDGLHLDAFKEIHRQHPVAMRRWLSEDKALGSMKIAYGLANGKPTKKRSKLFELATLFGADWSIHRPGIASTYPHALATYDQAVAHASAYALKAHTQAAPTASRPRF